MLPCFHGSGETEWAPLPDLIIASGRYSYELLQENGLPGSRLMMGGNFRYQYLWTYAGPQRLPLAEGRFPVLVALPVDQNLAEQILHALKKAFPDGGLSDGIEFMVKPHPMCPINRKRLRWPASFVEGTFEETLRRCAAVLYSGSGTGMEALAMGRIVLRYRPELLLDMDNSEPIKSNSVIDCGNSDIREKLLSLLHAKSLRPSSDEINQLLTRIFPLPDTEVWLEAVERLSSGRRRSEDVP
jgi:hypothetical protein